MTAFDLLLDELQRSCGLTPAQCDRMRPVFASWSRQTLRMPSSARWLREAARDAAARMLVTGEPVPIIRDRIMSMGVPYSTAYLLIRQAKTLKDHHAAAE